MPTKITPSSSAPPSMSRSFYHTSAKPPPLPTGISARLQSTIDPLTGYCKHHPKVQICQLVDDDTRWVMRRKVCVKCGSRTPVGGYDKRVPGKAVTNPAQRSSRDGGLPAEIGGRGRSRSKARSKGGSQSVPSSQPPAVVPAERVDILDRSGGDGNGGSDDERRERRRTRTPSRPRNRSGEDDRHTRRPTEYVEIDRNGGESISGSSDDERFGGRRRSQSRHRAGGGNRSGSDEDRHPTTSRSSSYRRGTPGPRRSASRSRACNNRGGNGDDGIRESMDSWTMQQDEQPLEVRRRSASRPRNRGGDDDRHGRPHRSASRPRAHRRRDCDDIKGKTACAECRTVCNTEVRTVNVDRTGRHQLAIVPQGNVRKQ
jgi:hypothetical protein